MPADRSGAPDDIHLAVIDTPLGEMLAGAAGDALCLLEFDDPGRKERQLGILHRLAHKPLLKGEHAIFTRLKSQLRQYFAGERTDFDIPLWYPGTDFQRRVWQALLEIPCGETRSYGQVALAVGRPGAARAVGTANGCNRIAIIIPCHRVIAANGAPGGYGGGLWRKQRLLDLERARQR